MIGIRKRRKCSEIGSISVFMLSQICNSSAMPFIICQNIHCKQIIYGLAGKLFMSGVRPIEIIIQYALSEQALTSILHNHFCMAELLPQICFKNKNLLPFSFHYVTISLGDKQVSASRIPAASNGASNVKRPKGRGIRPSRQSSRSCKHDFDSLLAGIKNTKRRVTLTRKQTVKMPERIWR